MRSASHLHRDKAYLYGWMMTKKLRSLDSSPPAFEIPDSGRDWFAHHRIENIRALRKDVCSRRYGGDITRKRKLLEKQKLARSA